MTVDPSTMKMPLNEPQAVQNHWRAFCRRWRDVFLVLLCLAAILTVIQTREEWVRHAALRDIESMGFDSSFRASRIGPLAEFVATNRELTDAEIETLGANLLTLTRPHDFGMSDGLAIQLVDLTQSHASLDAITKLQRMLPTTEIPH
jgi:hypothetical protein